MTATDMTRIAPAIITGVRFDEERVFVLLTDGRELGLPLDRLPRLARATPEQQASWEIGALGTSVRWPAIDEDLGVNVFLGVDEDLVDDAAGFVRAAETMEDLLRPG